jgi:hypothetical protein
VNPLSFATSLPLLTNLALLLGLSLFFGLAFEEFEPHQGRTQPGGVRTFPLLALAGAMLYLLDATHPVPVSVGVLVLGAWLYAYYRSAVAERDAEGVPNVGLTVPVCNLLAYLLGPIALTQPHWVAVGLTVTAVLLLTGRERLHTMARQLELPEIVTAGKFLILTGIILPLLPNEPITPRTRRRQFFSAASASLKIMASAVLFERHPLERTVRWRTVANEFSMGLVVRRCFQCSAGKS